MAAMTEELASRCAPDDQVLNDARGLIRKNRYSNLGVSADETWLLGECQGSARVPYKVSVDLVNPQQPVGRCNCGSRKFPCKHAVGLMLLRAQLPGKFAQREPDQELLAKREKAANRVAKQEAKPKKVNTTALAKKVRAQRDGLDLLEKLLIDLVASGQWFERSRLNRLNRQSKQLTDSFLRGAAYSINRLVLLADQDYLLHPRWYDWEDDDDDDTEVKPTGIPEEEKLAIAADLIAQLWATVQKGRNYLDGKIAGDESAAEADAVMEGVLGKAWKLDELRGAGYYRQDLILLELAYEHYDDRASDMRIEISHLLELKSGDILQAITYRPFKAMGYIAEQPSYHQPLKLAEAAVYPGFINCRVRWEANKEQAEELKPQHLKVAHDAAITEFKQALDRFRKQLKHPLAPREAVMLLQYERIGYVGETLVIEDASGQRLAMADRPDLTLRYSNVANLECAGGSVGKRPALLARLFIEPVTNVVLAQPLALVTPQRHVRLGL